MTAAQLRQSILQAAVQGKLVPQNAHDEPASMLLERIRAEKINLIRQGKIKKEKPLPPITEDEVPYDLPEGWVWCRLGKISLCISTGPFGSMLHKADYVPQGIPLVNPANIQKGAIIPSGRMMVSPQTRERLSSYILQVNDIVIARRGDLGRCAIVSKNEDGWLCGTGSFIVRISQHINLQYFTLFFRSPECVQQLMQGSVGSTMNNLNHSILNNLAVTIPPFVEQQRIVAKVDELMALCDELEAAEKELDTLESNFAEHLSKSILQAAVQGKLVPQNVHDEPASVLLERIRAEKTKLIKQGKIKKEKPLPPIAEDEAPYDLPVGWMWCRLNDVCEYIQRGRSPKYSYLEEVPVLSQKCVQWEKVTLDRAKFIEPNTLHAYGEERFLKSGDLLWNSTGHGTLGRIAQFNIRETKYQKIVVDSHVTVIRGVSGYVDSRYLLCWFSGPIVQDEIVGKSSGSTNQIELATSTIMSYLVPLPPLAEQQRIVVKVDELMALCNELKTAEALTIAPASSAAMIPFPARVTAPEKPAVEEEYLIAARGDMQNLSAEAANDIDELLNSNADS